MTLSPTVLGAVQNSGTAGTVQNGGTAGTVQNSGTRGEGVVGIADSDRSKLSTPTTVLTPPPPTAVSTASMPIPPSTSMQQQASGSASASGLGQGSGLELGQGGPEGRIPSIVVRPSSSMGSEEGGGSEDLPLTSSRRVSFTRVRVQPVGAEMLTQPLLKPTVYSVEAIATACRDQLVKMKVDQPNRWLRLICEVAIRRALKMVPPSLPPYLPFPPLPSSFSLPPFPLPPSSFPSPLPLLPFTPFPLHTNVNTAFHHIF